jgi:multidrug efflux pump subunit AcrB
MIITMIMTIMSITIIVKKRFMNIKRKKIIIITMTMERKSTLTFFKKHQKEFRKYIKRKKSILTVTIVILLKLRLKKAQPQSHLA